LLKDKVVIVTGASGRIGSNFSRAIVKNGGMVVMADTNSSKGVQLEHELGNDKSVFINTNILDTKEIDGLINKGTQKFGKIDAAIHSAYPVSKQWGLRFEELNFDLLGVDLAQQLGGAIIFSQRMIRYFKTQSTGNLVHVSSILGVQAPKFHHYEGTPMVSPIEYSAIKSGIISITKYLAKYCKGDNIRVNCISPGGILDKQNPKFLDRYNESCLTKGMLDSDDLFGTLVYLLSDGSKYVSGQNIIVDDGWGL
jgi:NAD(P)-dependent dehydrogenase (short-subunit alcohol dehydrogenase family)